MNRNASSALARPVAELFGRATRRLVSRIGKIITTLRSARPGVTAQRLGAHLQADIGLRDTRLTRHEAANNARRMRQFFGPDEVIRHQIWTDLGD